jgi:hypothetical protein
MTHFFVRYALALLSACCLFSCRPSTDTQPQPVALSNARQASNAFLFDGNPGIATEFRDDLMGTATGGIGGQTVKSGPDKPSLVRAKTFYLNGLNPNKPSGFTVKAGGLEVNINTANYMLQLFLRGPVRVGDYKIVKAGSATDEPLTVSATLYPRDPATGLQQGFQQQAVSNKVVRITAISASWIDMEYGFSLPNAPDERVVIRLQNFLNENANVKATNPPGAPWDYKATRRLVTIDPERNYSPAFGSPMTANDVVITLIQTLATPVSTATYAGQTARFDWQSSTLKRVATPAGAAELRLVGGTNYTPAGASTGFEVVFKDFKGAGTYTDNQASVRYTVSAGGTAGWWQINTGQKVATDTRTQVVVARVTPDVIEGTYTVQKAPIQYGSGSVQPSGPVSLSGTFSVIYPR